MTLYGSMQVCKYAHMHIYESMHVCKYANMKVCTYAHICKYASMHIPPDTCLRLPDTYLLLPETYYHNAVLCICPLMRHFYLAFHYSGTDGIIRSAKKFKSLQIVELQYVPY